MKKVYFFACLMGWCLTCQSLHAQSILDRILDSNEMMSVSYRYLLGIKSEGKLLSQLHGFILSTPEGYCDSNEQRVTIRSGKVLFEAIIDSKTIQAGFLRDSRNGNRRQDKMMSRKVRDMLLNAPGSTLKIDSLTGPKIKIIAHFKSGAISDMELEIDHLSLKIESFFVRQRVRLEQKLYEYELGGYQFNHNARFGDIDESQFFTIENKRVRPANKWRNFKINNL